MKIALLILVALCETSRAAPTAEDYFNDGQVAYDQGNFALAVARWQASYQLSREPALLYNLGQAYRLAGDCEHALSSYRQFLAADPTSDRRSLAEGFTRELEASCVHPAEGRRTVDVDPRSGRILKTAGLAMSGSGAVLVITGLLFGRRASTLGDEVTTTCTGGCDWASEQAKDARGRRYENIGYAFDAVGFVAIAGGAVLYYVGSKRTLAIEPRSSDNGAIVSWSGSW